MARDVVIGVEIGHMAVVHDEEPDHAGRRSKLGPLPYALSSCLRHLN
jgi:hypothetical protein